MAALGDTMDDLARFEELEHVVRDAEHDGLRARWEFGRELLAYRVGAKLPAGLLDEVSSCTGAGRRELQYRIMFAERFPSEKALRNAVAQYGSWHALVSEGLPRKDSPAVHVVPEIAAASGVYQTIVVDPPWQYDNRGTRGAAADHYPTMTLQELAELEVPADGDAHLYLWTTSAFLPDSFDLIDAWGFTYKTCLVWVKPQMGMGNYFRSSHELVLFGIRGKPKFKRKDARSWFEAPRGKHSAKPDVFYELVESCSPGPYLDMFNRDGDKLFRRKGWDGWGLEA
jgi:N6-adenosine-specific RNA methylase IME4